MILKVTTKPANESSPSSEESGDEEDSAEPVKTLFGREESLEDSDSSSLSSEDQV